MTGISFVDPVAGAYPRGTPPRHLHITPETMTHSDPTWAIATYNIRLGIQRGLPAIATSLSKLGRPHILAVQEIGDHWRMGPPGNSCAKLSRLLALPHHVFVPTIVDDSQDSRAARYGHALFSQWPISDHEIIPLPRHQDEPRALLRSRVQTPTAAIEVLSTHLSHRQSDRPAQGQFLHQWLDANPRTTDGRFLLGDLNAPCSEPWMAHLLQRFNDADDAEQRPTFPEEDPVQRIDYILGDGVDLHRVEVASATGASDHRPIFSQWCHD